MGFFFPSKTINDFADLLASFQPSGKLWNSKCEQGTNFYKLNRAQVKTFKRLFDDFNLLLEELPPDRTSLFLTEWEKAVGLPDDCFTSIPNDLEERRRNILIKLAYMNVATLEDIKALFLLLGFNITIVPKAVVNSFIYTFPATFSVRTKEDVFTLKVSLDNTADIEQFTGVFPFKFAAPDNKLARCILEKIKPANVKIEYDFNIDSGVNIDLSGFSNGFSRGFGD